MPRQWYHRVLVAFVGYPEFEYMGVIVRCQPGLAGVSVQDAGWGTRVASHANAGKSDQMQAHARSQLLGLACANAPTRSRLISIPSAVDSKAANLVRLLMAGLDASTHVKTFAHSPGAVTA